MTTDLGAFSNVKVPNGKYSSLTLVCILETMAIKRQTIFCVLSEQR